MTGAVAPSAIHSSICRSWGVATWIAITAVNASPSRATNHRMPTTPEADTAPPARPVRALLLLIRIYRVALSPLLGPRCRYLPSCSEYAAEALKTHGLLRGGRLAVQRVLRCHPWGGSGIDPVPPQ